MYATTCTKPSEGDDDAPQKTNHFTAPGFCYAFPLLKLGMLSLSSSFTL